MQGSVEKGAATRNGRKRDGVVASQAQLTTDRSSLRTSSPMDSSRPYRAATFSHSVTQKMLPASWSCASSSSGWRTETIPSLPRSTAAWLNLDAIRRLRIGYPDTYGPAGVLPLSHADRPSSLAKQPQGRP